MYVIGGVAVLIFIGMAATGASGMTGGKLTAQQVAAYARNAGFTGDDLVKAVAIAFAESSGNPTARGDNGDSIGLWQIDRRYHPEFTGWDLTEPQQNANAAFSVYQAAGNSFSPWSTYKSSAYVEWLNDANVGVNT